MHERNRISRKFFWVLSFMDKKVTDGEVFTDSKDTGEGIFSKRKLWFQIFKD